MVTMFMNPDMIIEVSENYLSETVKHLFSFTKHFKSREVYLETIK